MIDGLEYKINIFLDKLNQEKNYIFNPNDYIYSIIPDATTAIIIECLRYIIENNKKKKKEQQEKIKALQESVKKAQDIKSEEITSKIDTEQIADFSTPTFDFKPYIDLIIYSSLDAELEKKLANLSPNELKIIKLEIYKRKTILENKIKTSIITNPSFAITSFQEEYQKLQNILSFLNSLNKQEENTLSDTTLEPSNIIIVPNHNSKKSYLYEDILRYISNRKEIKNTIDKILDGYFLKTRDTKSIVGLANNNLYEYRHPNGLRILYIAEGNYIFICSLFYKDKQKSIKIENYYREAISRYELNKEYILSVISSPDFYIEQDELIGQITSLLEESISLKKVGDK